MKLKVLTTVLGKAIKKRKVIPITWIACMFTKIYSILFSTFWLLYILSFKGTKVADNQEALNIYSNVMIVSVICGVAFIPLVGKYADSVNPKIALPLAFLVRLSSIVAFYFTNNPKSYFSYGVSIWMVLGTLMESVTNDAILFRNADTQIRGVIYGTANAFGFLGQFLFSLAGGWLFDKIGPKAPFYLVGCCDLFFFALAVIAGCCNIITNDIAQRKIDKQEKADFKERKINEQNALFVNDKNKSSTV